MSDLQGSTSRHFVLHPITQDILAAIAINGGYAISNSGLIDLGDQLIVFDSFLAPEAAQDLREIALARFERVPQIVINSHYHNDHVWGNQAFARDAQVVSSTGTRELMVSAGRDEYDWYSSNALQRLYSLRTQYNNTSDERQKNDQLLWIGEYEGIVQSLPGLELCLPNITFRDQLEIHGNKHSAILITFDEAHTGSDTILHLPQQGVVFMGDLFFAGCHPYLADGNPQKLLQALIDISQLGATWYVPGHGPFSRLEDLTRFIHYIEQCIDIAHRLHDTGDFSEKKINDLIIPKEFQHWCMNDFYRSNIKFLCQSLNIKTNTQ